MTMTKQGIRDLNDLGPKKKSKKTDAGEREAADSGGDAGEDRAAGAAQAAQPRPELENRNAEHS